MEGVEACNQGKEVKLALKSGVWELLADISFVLMMKDKYYQKKQRLFEEMY